MAKIGHLKNSVSACFNDTARLIRGFENDFLYEVEWIKPNVNASGTTKYVPIIDTELYNDWDKPLEVTGVLQRNDSKRHFIIANYGAALSFNLETSDQNQLRFYGQGSLDYDSTFVTFDYRTGAIPLDTPVKFWLKLSPKLDAAHTVDYDFGWETLDGSSSSSQAGAVYRAGTCSDSLLLFADYRAIKWGSTWTNAFDGGLKLHYLKYKNGAVQRNWIPCITTDRVPCLFEIIEKRFYKNISNGDFSVGRRIREVEWIHLNASQWFNTDFIPSKLSTTMKAHIKLDDDADGSMIGSRQTASYPVSCSIYRPAANTSFPYSRYRLDWMCGSTILYTNSLTSTDNIIEVTGNYAKVDGIEYAPPAGTELTTDTKMSDPFYIGCAYQTTGVHNQYPMAATFYYVSLLNTYTREYYRYCVPAIDENDTPYFFDRVTHTICDNAGTKTDEITYGDEIHPTEYLYGMFPDRFNTGRTFYGYTWETDCQFEKTRDMNTLLGSAIGACNYWGVLSNGSSALYGIYSIHTSDAAYGINIDSTVKRTITTKSYTEGSYDKLTMTVEGQSVTRSTTSGVNKTTGYRVPSLSATYTTPVYLYGTRSYDNTTSEQYQNYIPIQKGNREVALFDTVNHVIATNENTGDKNLLSGKDLVGYSFEKELPIGMVKLEYLESVGTQYIETGITMNSTYGVEIDAKQTATTTSVARYLFGDAPAQNTRYLLCVTSGADNYRFGLENGNKDSSVNAYDGRFHVHKVKDKTYYIDGTSYGSLSVTDFTGGRASRLFNVQTTSSQTENYWQVRYCKIFDDSGRLIADMIPALRLYDNKPGMYDLVRRQFLTNAGSGEFKYEVPLDTTKYRRLSYLENIGTSYIDTGLHIDDTCGFKIEAQAITAKDAMPIGVKGAGNTRWCYNPSTSNVNLSWNTIYKADDTSTTPGTTTAKHIVKLNYFNDRKRFLDATEKDAITETLHVNASTYSVCLFAAKWADETPSLNFTGRIYSVTITKGNSVLGNYIPALRLADNKPGMYDTMTGNFLTNAGTGEFVYPLKEAEYRIGSYLQSSGTQMIDLGVIPDENMGINIEYAYPTISSSTNAGILGTYQANSPRTDTFFVTTVSGKTTTNIILAHAGQSRNMSVTPVANTWYNAKINWMNDGLLTLGNTSYAAGTGNIVQKSLPLFARWNPNDKSYACATARIKRLQISYKDKIIHNYIPVKRIADNKPGMYDTIENRFYTNVNSGTDFTFA